MIREKLSDKDEWLAAEYAIGVLSGKQKQEAVSRFDNDQHFRSAVEGWNNQLEPMLDEVKDVAPPAGLWKAIESDTIGTQEPVYREAGLYNAGIGAWKWITAGASTLAVASVALLMFVTGGDITGQKIAETRNQLVASNEKVVTLTRELDAAQATAASASGELDAVRQQITSVIAEREASIQEIAALEDQLDQAQQEALAVSQRLATIQQEVTTAVPLVASLTQSGDAPAFVAQYDPLSRSLLIRTSASDSDEKVPEVWFIPEKGAKKGQALSLGVMNENAPERLEITEEFIPWMDEGGRLAITMEPAGGSPTGVATGPIIAIGSLQALR